MPAVRRHLRWICPALVLGIAALLRLWALGRPGTLVFDELYYVRDAISQLAHGFPTQWPDDDPDMSGARATAFTDAAENAVHPPLGKWLIGLGILAFGPGSGWGWRFAVAVAGVLTVAVTMRLGWLMSRSLVIACVGGLLLAIDGVHVVLTRVGLLDGFLAFFVALGALFVWRDLEWTGERGRGSPAFDGARIPILWARPWLFAAAAAFGAAAAVKWSGLYPLAFFLVFITVRDLLQRLRRRERLAALRAAGQACVAALIALPTALVVYLASWTGWIVTSGGWDREGAWPAALIKYHLEMWRWHSTLSAPHPYQANPLTWPLALRPTGMYEVRWGPEAGCSWAGGCVAGVSPLPNPLVTWAGVAALLVLVVLVVRAAWASSRGGAPLAVPAVTAAAFVLTGYLSGWLPWVLTFSRSAVFQFYAVVLTPFAALGLALVLGILCGVPIVSRGDGGDDPLLPRALRPLDAEDLRGRRIAVALFLAFAIAVALFFFPVWSGMPVAEWFWRAHLWLPGWS